MLGHKGLAHKTLQVFDYNKMCQTLPGFNTMIFYHYLTIIYFKQFTNCIPRSVSSYLQRQYGCVKMLVATLPGKLSSSAFVGSL
jgi:hypothetical protein